ncbi:glycosyltransferase family 4 protein [Mycolicibacterium fortuitum]|uniref:GDP-mannose-dependent alpha-mannosyltransferase n=1 Tax=Mycolicibacterium fortuitum subsp. fortuitum DSM 46621 = ATCC 6841 = JCM 6387 TaxID=1214102 RepID=K0V9D7_MYCFO|nr:glycosyltransferase family 1 protein [Mycolicibacterium fortuitum]AIY48296.1 Glycosyltransferase [Mycobacterium sp. VKM Ac-1817D]CRL73016.1 glycosyltransferase [Mycolicibacter nonchromogenicus]EJZ14250.1 group 1 glycosyl transferase [Mycolicibacterium fortuitum subsp. fortuitum DSM 46621 = ATCC 6841 = JCM 6387]WEV31963.1 glycosyltransferase family 1 protein [Mycolicibacterium fortuitum]CRL52877.1 glycosyltransferase [Mycolicibacterium fortuitum subsp. fortuitum DSM 46621 = ATCC 6841 = JCM 6
MHVAIVAESFLPNVNGVTNSVLRVIEHLRRTGHEVLVIAPDTPRGQPPAERVHDGVRVHRVPSRMFPKVTSLPLGVPRPRMVNVLRGFDPDVVHLASPALLGWGGVHAARHLGVPTVAVFQTDVAGFAESYGVGVLSRASWAWTRRLHSKADRTLAPSTSAMENLEAHRIPRVFKWGRGVDITGFAPSARDEQLRASWSPEGRPIVGFVGRLAPEKHVERLAALAGRDDLQLVVVGDGVDRAKLQTVLPTAVFTGELHGPALAAAYASMDVFVHPGEHETFCQAVQEAMASGLPVIAPDAGGPRDLVAPYRTGLLLPVAEFESALPASAEHLIAERSRYSLAARRSVLARTWPAICDELIGHYEAVQGMRRLRAA